MDGNSGSNCSDAELRSLVEHRKYVQKSMFFLANEMPPDPAFRDAVERVTAQDQIENDSRPALNFLNTGEIELECSACPGEGCKVDHGSIRIARTINGITGKSEFVDVKEDTGSEVNWIAPTVVTQLRAAIVNVGRRTEYVGMMGENFVPRQQVALSLLGQSSKSHYGDFFIAPAKFPFHGVVVGNAFIKACGHPHSLFPERKKTSQFLLMMQKKATSSELESIEPARAEMERRAAELADQRRQRSSGSTPAGAGSILSTSRETRPDQRSNHGFLS